MTKFWSVAALALMMSGGMCLAKEPAAPELEKIKTALKEAGCEGGEAAVKKDGFAVDDVTCKDGQYDIKLDASFKIVSKKKE